MGSIWHIGIAVPDLDKGQTELGDVFGLRWRPARVRKLTLADAAGRPYAAECHVVFSLGGPFAVEVWQAIPGTPLDMPQAGGVHHIGYWVGDLDSAMEQWRRDLGVGPFHVIEVWVENESMVEILPPEFAREYLAFTRPDKVAAAMAAAAPATSRHRPA